MSYYLAVTEGPCDPAMSALSGENAGAITAKIAPSAFLYHFPSEGGTYVPGLDTLKRFAITIAEVGPQLEVCSLGSEYQKAFDAFNRARNTAANLEGQVPM